MRHFAMILVLVGLMLPATASAGMYAIDADDLTGEPTVYATVLKEPNPLLLGCYMRMRPSEYKRPNKYEYCLVKKGDKYAVFYYWQDGKTNATSKGWAPFTVNGDEINSGTEPSKYLVHDGNVWHNYGGRDVKHKMKKFD